MSVDGIRFTNAFRAALPSEPGPDLVARWGSRGQRTQLLKGAAHSRTGSILHRTFQDLGYKYGDGGANRLFAYEWNQKDIVAVDGLGEPWDKACWRGRYRYDIVCEVENDLPELEMTMRGMLDLRARLSVGIFFASESDPTIGEGTWSRGHSDLRPFSSWIPPSGASDEFPWIFARGDEMLIVLLSKQRPEILSVRRHVFDGKWSQL